MTAAQERVALGWSGSAESRVEVVFADRVGRAGAESDLASRWRLVEAMGRRGAAERFELLWLPVVFSAPTGVAREARLYIVERVLGHGWALSLAPRSAVSESTPDGTTTPARAVLPARIDVEACASRLEALATQSALILGRGRQAALHELGPGRPAIYPFWLRYRRDRRGRVRFDALDAVTGSRAGKASRAALAAALVAGDAADPVGQPARRESSAQS